MDGLSRRRFVVGGIAAGCVGVGAAGALSATRYHGVRRWLHSARVLPGPNRSIPDVVVAVEEGTLPSHAMGRDVSYAMSLPRDPPVALLICLHGRGGNHRDAFDHIGVHRFVAAAGLPYAVASVDGGESFWRKRADGTDAQALVVDELLPLALRRAPGAKPIVLGWSMGGYGALLAAIRRPDAFRVVVANSPSIWYSASASPPGAFDDDADFAHNDVLATSSALAKTPVLVDVGEDDYFAGVVRDLHRREPSLAGGVHPGFHDDGSWRAWLPRQLVFISERLTG